MKKSVMLMAGILAVALAGSAQAAGNTMFAVQDTTGTIDKAIITDTGDIVTVGTVTAPKMGVGVTTPDTIIHAAESNNINATRGIISAQHNDGAQAPLMLFRKSRGVATTVAQGDLAAMVQTGDFTASFDAQGWDGYNYLNGGGAVFVVDGPVVQGNNTITNTALGTYPGRVPTAYAIYTGNKTGSIANNGRGERFRIASDGRLRISNQPAAPTNGTACTTNGDLILDTPNGFLYLCSALVWKRATFN